MGRLCAVLMIVAGLTLAPAALADSALSSNWAGYAVHRPGASFRAVQAAWREPAVTCTAGRRTFSSYWVGLGGFSQASQSIEQIGTEADCTRFGVPRYSAWYELLPAPSEPIRLAIAPGDVVAAKVTVRGRRVAFELRDLTSGRAFSQALFARRLDLSSAEWIVEAPSDCLTATQCVTLPLADFGAASFTAARAQGALGRWGTIARPFWRATRITLQPGAQRLLTAGGAAAASGGAHTGPLAAGGQAFTVSYSAAPGAIRPGGLHGVIRLGPRAAGAR